MTEAGGLTSKEQAGGWLETVNERRDRGRVRAALFDFDGTISLIRQGWQDVMMPMMVEVLLGTPRAGSEEETLGFVKDFVAETTGKQTIYQMIGLAEEVERRGGRPLEPLEYKREYIRRLQEKIGGRVSALESGEKRPCDFLMPGVVEFLAALTERGVVLYCASGTDEPFARHEAELLGAAGFFEGGVRGAQEDYRKFSKKDVIASIIREHGLGGAEFACFGDGFVEIEEGAKVGALTVGVASSEERLLSGKGESSVDEWKRKRLIDAGADAIVPDFRNAVQLIGYLFCEFGRVNR